MSKLQALLARVKVLLTAAPTYLVAAGAVVSIISSEISKVLPTGWQDNALQIGGALTAIIAAAVAIVRRVTPVLIAERGLLSPPDGPKPPDPAEQDPPEFA